MAEEDKETIKYYCGDKIDGLVNFSNETSGCGTTESNDGDFDDDYDYDDSNASGKSAMIYVYATIFVIGVSGNLWVLYWIAGRKKRTKSVTNIFIFNLSIADLFLMLCLPTIIMRMIIGEWIFGWFLCKIYFTFDGVNKFASVAFLVLLSLDRYLAVCHPITSRTYRNTNTAIALVATTWIIVGMLMVPVFIFANVTEMPPGGNHTVAVCAFLLGDEKNDLKNESSESTDIEPRLIFTLYTFALAYLLPLLLITVFYLLIVCRLKRQEQLLGERTIISTNHRSTRRKKRTSRQISVMILTIVGAYTFCWLPYWILQLGLELFSDTLLSMGSFKFKVFTFVAYSLQISNSALNPFLYALGTDNHRREMFTFISQHCLKCCPKKFFGSNGHDDAVAEDEETGTMIGRCQQMSVKGSCHGGTKINLAASMAEECSKSKKTTKSKLSPAKSPKLLKLPHRPCSDLSLLKENSESNM